MRNLVIMNKNAARRANECVSSATVDMHGIPVTIGVVETPDTRFASKAPHRAKQVLVRVKAISCSYRDQSVILAAAVKDIGDDITPIGTEFVAEVLAVGSEVTRFKIGDRVIPVSYFPDQPAEWRTPTQATFGLPTQKAARELSVFSEDELVRVPASMPDDVAASFTTCPQTAYAMIRRAGVTAGTKVLVTAPRSSTSLNLISALANIGAEIYAVGTSDRHEGRLRELGVRDLLVADPRAADIPLGGLPEPDCVFDVYADLYFPHAIRWLAPAGVYVTCGVVDQYQRTLLGTRESNVSTDLTEAFGTIVGKNLSILGSCLGMPSDLERAVADYDVGKFQSIVDSTVTEGQVGEYVQRSFISSDRFGKVVYRFNSAS